MTTTADAPSGAISYAEWLQRKITDRLNSGVERMRPGCLRLLHHPDRLGLTQRPNAALERQLEIQLRELEHQAKPEARTRSRGGNRDVTADGPGVRTPRGADRYPGAFYCL